VYLYHADERGHYAEGGQPGSNADNPRLFAFVRTDARGRARLRSIVPGAYGRDGLRHVHLVIDREGGAEYGTTIFFEPDAPPSAELREEAAREGAHAVRLEPEGDAARARARIELPRG
jgi:protocatechuate 3,4-dioxygenase beta subunit